LAQHMWTGSGGLYCLIKGALSLAGLVMTNTKLRAGEVVATRSIYAIMLVCVFCCAHLRRIASLTVSSNLYGLDHVSKICLLSREWQTVKYFSHLVHVPVSQIPPLLWQ
jgi:hypothetical protein